MKVQLRAAASLLFIAATAAAQPAAEKAWSDLLPALGVTRAELSLRPERWETRMTNSGVERLLSDPLAAPELFGRWEAALAPNSELLRMAASALPAESASAPPMPDVELACDSLTPELDQHLSALSARLEVIERQAKAALPSPAARRRLEAGLAPFMAGEDKAPLDGALFDEAAAFDAGRLVALAADADLAVREVLPYLRDYQLRAPRRKIRCGDLLVGSRGDDDYSALELAGAALVVDLGGRNRYAGPAAAASDGQVRVVVDLGTDAVFESTGAAAGSGRFGIGLLYALGGGTTTIKAGDYSAGAGFFGAGAALVAGAAVVETGAFSQGAGAFGAGALELQGPASASARFAAQGFGSTRGVGLFVSRAKLDARCGLSLPDPRESLAWLSMCQGAGYGPRAYAAGGWGVARVDGAGSRLEAGYFAQGAGYWRAAGLLSVFGAGTTLQARRYAQGSGVHVAVGGLRLRADHVKTFNWGVGPGYGWDLALGVLDAEGDHLVLQNDWSGGRADANSRALVRVSGSSATLAVHGLSYGSYSRAGPGWALVSLEGSGHAVRAPGLAFDVPADGLRQTPYGLLAGQAALSPAVSTQAVAWPSGERAAFAEREAKTIEARLEAARGLSPVERSRELLFIVSQFGLAPAQVAKALDELAKMSTAEAPFLVAALSPERFDELIWIRLLAAALGRPAGWAAKAAADAEAAPLRRSLLIGLLRAAPLDVALDPALAALSSPDWRARREAVGALGALLDASRGEEPGRLAFLEDSLAFLNDDDQGALLKKAGVKRLADLYAALALADRLPLSDRVALLEAAATPFDAVGEPALKKYAELLRANKAAVKSAFEAELAAARKAQGRARKALAKAASDPDEEVASAALVSLGGLGSSSDAGLLAAELSASTATRRLAAVAGLARLGPAASSAVASALESREPKARAGAALAAGRTWDGELLVRSLLRALTDPDDSVRLAALSSITSIQTPLLDRRAELRGALERAAASANPAERAAASARLAELPK